MDAAARHNAEASRFELDTPDGLAVAEYRRTGGAVVFTHTGVPETQQGAGLGEALAQTALDWARAEGLAVVPQCAFFAAYIREHPAYQDLVEPGRPA